MSFVQQAREINLGIADADAAQASQPSCHAGLDAAAAGDTESLPPRVGIAFEIDDVQPRHVERGKKRRPIAKVAAARMLVVAQTMDNDFPIMARPPSAPDNRLTDTGATAKAKSTSAATNTDMHRPRNSFGMTMVKSVMPITATASTMVMAAT